MKTQIEKSDGWLTLKFGDFEIIVPEDLSSGADERIEIRNTDSKTRTWIDLDLMPSDVEIYAG